MLSRQLRKIAKPTAWSSSVAYSLRHRRFSLKFPLPTSSPGVISVAASDVADGGDMVYSRPVSPSVAMAPPNMLQPRVVIYDGVCPLCHGGVKWVIKADKYRKIKFCCVQSKAAEAYLRVTGLEQEDVLNRFLFIEGPGSYHQASTAALRVLYYLPLPYSALSTLMIIPAPLRDAVYDYVANRRYNWFGKSEGCLVLQEKELLERFIDRDELIGRS